MHDEVVAITDRLDRISDQLADLQQGVLVLAVLVILTVVYRYVSSLTKD